MVANFRPVLPVKGRIRIPPELAAAAGLADGLAVRLLLDRDGEQSSSVADLVVGKLVTDGFPVAIASQTACVYVVEETGGRGWTRGGSLIVPHIVRPIWIVWVGGVASRWHCPCG